MGTPLRTVSAAAVRRMRPGVLEHLGPEVFRRETERCLNVELVLASAVVIADVLHELLAVLAVFRFEQIETARPGLAVEEVDLAQQVAGPQHPARRDRDAWLRIQGGEVAPR